VPDNAFVRDPALAYVTRDSGPKNVVLLIADDLGLEVGYYQFHEITMYSPMRSIRTRQYQYIVNFAHQLEFPHAADLRESPTWQGILKRGDKFLQKGKPASEFLLFTLHSPLFSFACPSKLF
jgi:hypothetical protein